MLSKAVLRQAFRTNLDRDDHDQIHLAESARALSRRLGDFLRGQSGVWAAFEPMGFEPDIRSAIESSTHIRWAYPRVEHEVEHGVDHPAALAFYEIKSREKLVKNRWGIWEPDPAHSVRVALEEFHGLLIPGLAFDKNGNRLGRGRGYYDRALSEIVKRCATAGREAQPLKIGIALERQVSSEELPHDAHDIAMDLVVTESRSLKGSKK